MAFLASFQHPVSIFEQLSIIYQLPRMFVGSFTLVLPYFPTGTAERVSQRFGTDLNRFPKIFFTSPERVNGALWLHWDAAERAVEYIVCAASLQSYNGSNTCSFAPVPCLLIGSEMS